MTKEASNSASQDEQVKTSLLFRHKARPEWGLATIAWERNEKRGYQFEDGKLRIIKNGYYGFFEDVELPSDEAQLVLDALRQRLGWEEPPTTTKGSLKPTRASIERQVALFNQNYPGGFQDPVWEKDRRGIEGKRRLKRHREPSILIARKQLDKERLDLLMETEKYSDIIESMREVCKETDLVSKSQ